MTELQLATFSNAIAAERANASFYRQQIARFPSADEVPHWRTRIAHFTDRAALLSSLADELGITTQEA